MRFSSLQENLKNSLFVVGHIAGKNINLPILSNIMIQATKGEVNIITTDLEIGITSKLRGKVEKEGVFTVNAKIMHDYVSLLPNKKVDFELKNNILEIKCDNFNTKIKGQGAEEYPLIPKIKKENVYKISGEKLKKSLSQVVFATSNSETRMELTGVLFVFSKEGLFLAATDSYRLAEKRIEINSEKDFVEQKIIIPSKTSQELVRILSNLKDGIDGEDFNVEIAVNENQVVFNLDSVELVSRLIEGQYPDYKQIIPSNFKTKVLVNKQALVRAVKMSSLFSKNEVNDINLDFPAGKNKIMVSSASGMSGENLSEIDAKTSGDDNGVVVNHRYLLDGLNIIDSEFVEIEVVDSNTPCMIKPEKDSSYTYIIMPIKQ